MEELLTAALGTASTSQRSPSTMLAAFLETAADLPMTGRSTLGATSLGTERGHAVSRPPETPATLLTQTVSLAGQPVIAAKYILPAGAPLLHITHRR